MQAYYDVGDAVKIKPKSGKPSEKVFRIVQRTVNTYRLDNNKLYTYDELIFETDKEEYLEKLELEKEKALQEKSKAFLDFFA